MTTPTGKTGSENQEPALPLFVFEDWRMELYLLRDDVEVHLECIDVLNDEYVAFDAQGRLLELNCPDMSGTPSIRPAEDEPSHAVELRQRILLALKGRPMPPDSDKASLEDLVRHCLALGIFTARSPMRSRPALPRLFRWLLGLLGLCRSKGKD